MKANVLKFRVMFLYSVVFSLFFLGFFFPARISAQVTETLPENIDTSAEYLFFMHNYYVEINGPDGNCQYNNILKTFSDEGFIVISEIRSGKIVPCTYAKKVVGQVKMLMESGVPPKNIQTS
jgi:hypothetical protein